MASSEDKLEINLVLPDLLGEPPRERLSAGELRIVASMRHRASTNVDALLELLREADLEGSRDGMLFKSLLLLLGRRRKVGLNLVDPDSRGKIRMSFSLPVALFRYLCEHPMGVVLNADSETLALEVGVPRVLIERLKKDLTIVKIVLAYQGVAAGERRLFELGN